MGLRSGLRGCPMNCWYGCGKKAGMREWLRQRRVDGEGAKRRG